MLENFKFLFSDPSPGLKNREYYTVARRYEFYVLVAERVRYCSCHENIKVIPSS